MVVLSTYKNKEDPIKTESARVFTTFSASSVYGDFSKRSRAANSAVLVPIWLNSELDQDVMDVLVICKNQEDPVKNEGARVLTAFFFFITLWEMSVAMETNVLIRSEPKLNVA